MSLWKKRWRTKNDMPENFLPTNNNGEKWRATLAIMLMAGAGAFFLFSQKKIFAPNLAAVEKVIKPLQLAVGGAGGDLSVPPPQIVGPKLPELIGALPAPEKFTAHGIIVKDQTSGAVLYRKNEYDVWPVASITKLMSALILLEKNPEWSATTTVIGADSLDTHMYVGDTYTLEELWQAALVGSSNKAILSLANALDWPASPSQGGPEVAFVERMNQKAQELGMTETHFTDPSGLDDTNVSSASDIVMLLNEALKNDKIKNTLSQPELTLYSAERKKSHHLWNTDWLLLGWIPHDLKIRGGKTGYIAASGYNFAMQAENAAGRAVNVVILGAVSHEARFTEARDIAEAVFENYRWVEE